MRGSGPNARHSIKYGSQNFDSAKSSLIYIVSNGQVYKVNSKDYDREIHHVALIIEETAHYFQSIEEGGYIYGSIHNAMYIKHFRILWDKYSDYVMDEVRAALNLRPIGVRLRERMEKEAKEELG